MKSCTICRKTKPLTEFFRNRRSKDGLLCRCKACHKALMKPSRDTEKALTSKRREKALKSGLKSCSKCGITKPFSDFHPQADGFGGVRGDCKPCVRALNAKWLEENKERKAKMDKDYRERPDVKDRDREKSKEWHKEYYRKNKKKIMAKTIEIRAKRMKSDVNYLLLNRLRIRLYQVTSNVSNFREFRDGRKSLMREALGCTPNELRMYLEGQFEPGMTWDNYGVHGWHIDHKRPCAHFDFSKRENVLAAFHYSNLKPMWAKDNWSKGARFSE